jgi:hypothetical protein
METYLKKKKMFMFLRTPAKTAQAQVYTMYFVLGFLYNTNAILT